MAKHIVLGAAVGVLGGVARGYLWSARRPLFWLSMAVALVLLVLFGRSDSPRSETDVIAFFLAVFVVDLATEAFIRSRADSRSRS